VKALHLQPAQTRQTNSYIEDKKVSVTCRISSVLLRSPLSLHYERLKLTKTCDPVATFFYFALLWIGQVSTDSYHIVS
jgi:hypothetical protein